MIRALTTGILFTLVGCTLPPERAPLRPLVEDAPPLAYVDLLSRTRAQATSATEAFFVNSWTELEDLARGLEQTSRFLPKATDVPAKHQNQLKEMAATLEAESRRLQESAKAHDEKKTNEALQRINLLVRELRVDSPKSITVADFNPAMYCSGMTLVTPFWFAQRQGKAEARGTNAYELSAPDLPPAIIEIRQGPSQRWSAILRPVSDESELAATEESFDRPEDAWDAAFELFRLHRVV